MMNLQAKLTRQAKAFVLGDCSDEQVTMGPLIHQGAAAKVADLVSDAVAQVLVCSMDVGLLN